MTIDLDKLEDLHQVHDAGAVVRTAVGRSS